MSNTSLAAAIAAATHPKNCECDLCNKKNEVARTVREALHEEHEGMHNHLADISWTLKLLAGVTQRLLAKFEEAEGTPKGGAYVFSQANPVQATVYTGKQLAYDGVIRQMVLSGPGNVTVTLNDKLGIAGATPIAIASCNGNAIPIAIRHKMPLNATLSVSTDASAGTGLIALTAWIEPITESNPEFFRMRR